ncbi:hypothetical protein [Globicatella sp. PHS-GS-PNBC-21-1553]|uniref:hypothetical protein n=1 Tax=Globicatella sp. PHS-GS-PNBC-21-1553 TaxID=2885764 RepID=UPI00298EF315|nr:hypothetical protein [Globicatella sp. PHS-GS-PNBC-21-1553]WPC08618.1 hypothetical protein LB888_11615 [Globicatella sp. PHS-GS-PNBC-21-1553]
MDKYPTIKMTIKIVLLILNISFQKFLFSLIKYTHLPTLKDNESTLVTIYIIIYLIVYLSIFSKTVQDSIQYIFPSINKIDFLVLFHSIQYAFIFVLYIMSELGTDKLSIISDILTTFIFITGFLYILFDRFYNS